MANHSSLAAAEHLDGIWYDSHYYSLEILPGHFGRLHPIIRRSLAILLKLERMPWSFILGILEIVLPTGEPFSNPL